MDFNHIEGPGKHFTADTQPRLTIIMKPTQHAHHEQV